MASVARRIRAGRNRVPGQSPTVYVRWLTHLMDVYGDNVKHWQDHAPVTLEAFTERRWLR